MSLTRRSIAFALATMLSGACEHSQPGKQMIAMIRCKETTSQDAETETYASLRRWQSGEFRYCRTLKLPEFERDPQLMCDPALALLPEGASYDHGKYFTIRFMGGVPNNLEVSVRAENQWRCQRLADVRVPFLCTAITNHQ